jgi:hypothetical protein
MRALCLVAIAGACDHTYLVRHDDFRETGELRAIRASDDSPVTVDATKVSVEALHFNVLTVHGKVTRAVNVAGAVNFGLGLVLTVAGGAIWGMADAERRSCQAARQSFCFSIPEPGQIVLGVGLGTLAIGGIVLAVGAARHPEEQ